MNLQEWQSRISLIKDIVTILATVIGGGVAIYGLIAWKRQLKGKTEYELARRVLRAVYRVRDAIRGIRNPFQSSGEIAQALKEAGISIDVNSHEYRAQSAESVYQVRWRRLNEARSDLQLELLEAEVSWGNDIIDQLKPLNECVGELYATIWLYIQDLNEPYQDKGSDYAEQRERRRKILYEISLDPDKDPFSGQIKKAVEQIERFLKPHLKL